MIAEEGASAVAYVVISARGNAWTMEEVGDRDPAGARAGAILQALIAREPAEKRPAIGAWLPDVPAAAGHDRRRDAVRGSDDDPPLTDAAASRRRSIAAGVLYWRGDLF